MPKKDHNLNPDDWGSYRFNKPEDQKRFDEFLAAEKGRSLGPQIALTNVFIEQSTARGDWMAVNKLTAQMQNMVKAQARMEIELGRLVPIDELIGELGRAWGAILHDRITTYLNGGEPLPEPTGFSGPNHPWFPLYDELIREIAETTQQIVRDFAEGAKRSAPRSKGRKVGG